LILPLCYLGYLAADAFGNSAPEGTFRSDLPGWILFFTAVFALAPIAAFIKWLISSEPKPNRKTAEESLRAAEAEASSMGQAIAQKQAEIGQHQQLVGLGG
jgi:predicted MFS family arabinose efflux permease